MQAVGYILLAILVLAGAMLGLLSRNLIRAAIGLGFGSAALAMLFFMLGAPFAGGFELSVGSGLISVLFIVTITLTESINAPKDNEEAK
jgi:NADH-quinone oxidoreductase subunit J